MYLAEKLNFYVDKKKEEAEKKVADQLKKRGIKRLVSIENAFSLVN